MFKWSLAKLWITCVKYWHHVDTINDKRQKQIGWPMQLSMMTSEMKPKPRFQWIHLIVVEGLTLLKDNQYSLRTKIVNNKSVWATFSGLREHILSTHRRGDVRRREVDCHPVIGHEQLGHFRCWVDRHSVLSWYLVHGHLSRDDDVISHELAERQQRVGGGRCVETWVIHIVGGSAGAQPVNAGRPKHQRIQVWTQPFRRATGFSGLLTFRRRCVQLRRPLATWSGRRRRRRRRCCSTHDWVLSTRPICRLFWLFNGRRRFLPPRTAAEATSFAVRRFHFAGVVLLRRLRCSSMNLFPRSVLIVGVFLQVKLAQSICFFDVWPSLLVTQLL